MDSIAQGSSPRGREIADLAWIDFLFLLRPGEYCAGGIDTLSTPFNLCNTQFFVGTQPTQSTTASIYTCAATTFVSLIFTTQKNGVKGESIERRATGHPRAYAVEEIWRGVAHLQ